MEGQRTRHLTLLPVFPLPFITAKRIWGSAIAPPVGQGGVRPPNTFWCSSQPKICKSVVLMFHHVHKMPIQHFMTFWNSDSVRCKLLQCNIHGDLFNYVTPHCIFHGIKNYQNRPRAFSTSGEGDFAPLNLPVTVSVLCSLQCFDTDDECKAVYPAN